MKTFDKLETPRVLLIVPQPFFAVRGSPLRVRCTVEALLELGVEVDLLALPYGEELDIPGLRIYRTLKVPGVRSVPIGPSWTKLLFDILLSASASRLFLTKRYAAIHGIEEGGVIAAVLGAFGRRPYVFDMHSQMSEQLADGKAPKLLVSAVEFLERCAIKRASAVITVADELTAYAKNIAAAVPVDTIPDVPLTSSTAVDALKVQQYSAKFAPDGGDIVVYTGNFEKYQGVELLLESFALFLKRNTGNRECVLLLVGGAESGEGSLRFELENLAAKLGIERAVKFVGEQPVDEMGNFMALANVLVSPRITGGNTPLKVYSYMASGRSIVATRISSHTQVLNDCSAFLCEPTVEDLALTLESVLNTAPQAAAERQKRIAGAKESIAKTYNLQHFKQKLKNLYQTFLESPVSESAAKILANGR